MFARMIAAAVLLASAGVALASEVSFDRQQAQAPAAQAAAKSDAPVAPSCGCRHGRS
jgi:hypothetical protein